jgi:hypothetical protein
MSRRSNPSRGAHRVRSDGARLLWAGDRCAGQKIDFLQAIGGDPSRAHGGNGWNWRGGRAGQTCSLANTGKCFAVRSAAVTGDCSEPRNLEQRNPKCRRPSSR